MKSFGTKILVATATVGFLIPVPAGAANLPGTPVTASETTVKQQLIDAGSELTRAEIAVDSAAWTVTSLKGTIARETSARNAELATSARFLELAELWQTRIVKRTERVALAQQSFEALAPATPDATLDAAQAALARAQARLALAQKRKSQRVADARAADGRASAALVRITRAKDGLAAALTEGEDSRAEAKSAQKRVRSLYAEMVTPSETGSTPALRNAMADEYGAKNVTRSSSQAVDWALGWVGEGSEYNGRCLAFVDDSYQPRGYRVGTAIAQWIRARDDGFGHKADREPPIGAQVFWRSGNPARHIALYIGEGLVISTGITSGRVGIVTMETMDRWGPYIGWAPPYYSD